MLGTERTLVVHGADGLDEVTLADATHVTEATGEGLNQFDWTPSDFGLQQTGLESMLIEGPEDSARIIREVLDGQTGPARDIVVANAAAALWTAGKDSSLEQCAKLAATAIDDGAARDLLARLAERTWAK